MKAREVAFGAVAVALFIAAGCVFTAVMFAWVGAWLWFGEKTGYGLLAGFGVVSPVLLLLLAFVFQAAVDAKSGHKDR